MSQISGYISTTGPGSGTVTSVAAAGGLTAVPNPITTAGAITIDQTNLTVLDGTVYWDTGTQLLHTTATGTSGFVLTSNGAGLPPTYQAVSASGAVTSVSGGNNITITGTATAPIVNVSGTTNHFVQVGNASGSLTSVTPSTAGFVLTSNGVGSDPSFQVASASGAVTQLTGNSGVATPTAGNINVISSTAQGTATVTGSASTLTLAFTDGDFNTVLGTTAFATTHTPAVGVANTGLGVASLNALTTGSGNTAIGYNSAPSLLGGINNTVVGTNAMGSTTSGSTNTALGISALTGLISGSGNTALGTGAGSNYAGAESDNILIGNLGVLAESAKIRIGTNGTQTATFIAGIDGVNVGSVAKVVTMASDQLGTATITAGAGINVTPGANTITISSIGEGVTWSVITANQTAAVENGYFCNKAGTLTLALPAVSVVGDVIEVTNENTALGVQFTQAAGQQILIGNTNTTLGATGTLTSSAVGDTLKIVCKTANTIWRVTSMVGNWSVV